MYILLFEEGLKRFILKFGSGIYLQLCRFTTFLENAFKRPPPTRLLFSISRAPPTCIWKGHRYKSVNTCSLDSTDSNVVNQPSPPAITNLYQTQLLDYDESAFLQVCLGYSPVVDGANRILACV